MPELIFVSLQNSANCRGTSGKVKKGQPSGITTIIRFTSVDGSFPLQSIKKSAMTSKVVKNVWIHVNLSKYVPTRLTEHRHQWE